MNKSDGLLLFSDKYKYLKIQAKTGKVYDKKLYNKIQTQMFQSLYAPPEKIGQKSLVL